MGKLEEVAGLKLRCEQVRQYVATDQYKTWLAVQVKFFEIMHEPAFAEVCFQLWQDLIQTEKAQKNGTNLRTSAGGSPTIPTADSKLASQLKCHRYPQCDCTDGCTVRYSTDGHTNRPRTSHLE